MFDFLLNKSKKSSNSKESVFIHIPKCGGSTFVGLLIKSIKEHGFDSKTKSHKIKRVGNVSILHVNFESENRVFKAPAIFDNKSNSNFRDKLIFMLARNPIERLISEFNFQYHILNGKNGSSQAAILSKLKGNPKCIEDYIEYEQTQNYQTKFLLGLPLGSKKKIKSHEFQQILDAIESLPIYCGITEEYSSFLNLFQDKAALKLHKNVLVRKKTPFVYYAPISEEIKQRIIELNSFDFRLYSYIKERIKIDNRKFRFEEKDKFIV